jgi:hypothetical protein
MKKSKKEEILERISAPTLNYGQKIAQSPFRNSSSKAFGSRKSVGKS